MPAASRFRRFFQFRLRTLLMLMALCAGGLAWFKHHLARRYEARLRLETLPGKIEIDTAPPWASRWLGKSYGAHFDVVTAIDFAEGDELSYCKGVGNQGVNSQVLKDVGLMSGLRKLNLKFVYQVNDEGLSWLAGLSNLEELILDGTAITDQGAKHLAGMTSLKRLSLYATDITDEGLVHLSRLTNLVELDLSETFVGGGGLRHLRGLTELRRLNLYDTHVGDADSADLGKLTKLEYLNLSFTRITGKALRHVAQLTRLQELWLAKTRVDDASVRHLTNLTRLRKLTLARTGVGDSGAAVIVAQLGLKESRPRVFRSTRSLLGGGG